MPTNLLTDIRDLESGTQDWANMATSLIRVRDEHLWRDQNASSFTEFLNKVASNAHRTPFTYWRALAAAEFYRTFQNGNPDLKLPPLSTIGYVSPENIDLLQKISQLAPAGMVVELMQDLLDRKIGRTLLKNTWDIYRSALEGVERIEIDPPPGTVSKKRGKTKRRFLVEATLVARLLEQGSNWCCTTEPHAYRFYSHVRLPMSVLGSDLPSPIDAVAAVCMQRGGEVDLHGVFAAARLGDGWNLRTEELTGYRQFLDRSWLALMGPIDEQTIASIPRHAGIIEITPGIDLPHITIRQAGKVPPEDLDAPLGADATASRPASRSLRQDFVKTIRTPMPTKADGIVSGVLAKQLLARSSA